MKNIRIFFAVSVTMIFLALAAPAPVAAAPGNPPDNYKAVFDIVATAYAPGPHDNGPWGDLTHLGTRVRPGVIAVDPKLIPLGSKVFIEYADGHGEYASAEDTGGAIKGRRIDIAMASVGEANDFGIQKVKVYVIG
jgi:3D (Asp-Asp-Asp) domain-containing protein